MKKTQDDEMKRDGLPVDEDPSMENRYSDEYDRDEDLDMEEEVLSEYAGDVPEEEPPSRKPKKKKSFFSRLFTDKSKNSQQEPPLSHKEKNRYYVRVSYFIVAMFLSLCVYLVYFNVAERDAINSNSNNSKQDSNEDLVVRGSIYSTDGELLAGTNVAEDGTETRVYPFSNVFAHVVGYSTNGRSGAESVYNTELLTSHASLFEQIQNESLDMKVRGDSLVLTLDSRIQQACYNALGAYKGAIVVIEPSTGRILAMVSKPDFDPNSIDSDWEALNDATGDSPLYNRATQGLYPPGSTFKILTTLAYLRQHNNQYEDFYFNCQGVVTQEDVSITCYNGAVHGGQNLEQAFDNSCNGAFATIGLELDNKAFTETCEDFLFNQSIPINMSSANSLFPLPEDASYGEEMTTAIGQGNTVATPLQMAMVAATVANGGVMMTPYYVDRIETYDNETVEEYSPSVYKTVMTAEEAEILGNFMESVVTNGTASALSGQLYTAAGKTGSAEYDSDGTGESLNTHSWFVGYSNVDNPDIAVAVIAEDGGSGSSTAVPIAKQIFDTYYQYYSYD